MRPTIYTLLACLIATIPGLAGAAALPDGFPCKAKDKACAEKAGRAHVIKTSDYWKPAFAKPLEERVGLGSPELVEFVILDTISQSIPHHPRRSVVAEDFVADVREALAGLPTEVKALLSPRLAGVYFVDDIGGSGFADLIDAKSGDPTTGFIILDPTQLATRSANAWATWKERSPFKAHARYRLEAEIETDANDNRKNAIRYILLHELGHILSIGSDLHPMWNLPPKESLAGRRFPFFESSWRLDRKGERYESLFDAAFPERRSVVYYFGAKLAAAQMVNVYSRIEATNFPTLYAATHPGDDFAEAFASYVHTVMQKRPWCIRLYDKDQLVKTYTACWEEARCAAKRKLLESFLFKR